MIKTWTEICDSEVTAPKTGLYLFICLYNNHFAIELYRLNEDEKLWKYFTGEFEHFNGYYRITPVAYHYIDYYSNKSSSHWEASPNFDKESADCCCVWAYSRNGSNIKYALKCHTPAIYPECVYMDRKFDIFYGEEYWKGANFISYHKFSPHRQD